MKKALAIISAVAIASAFAFAEDAPALKLSGYLDTGIRAVSTNQITKTDTVGLTGDDSGTITRFDIDGTYTNGNAGVNFKLRDETAGSVGPKLNHFEAWTTLADGKVKLVSGILDTSAWKTEGDDGFTAENGAGLQVQVMPVAGLNVGVKFNTKDATNGSGTDGIDSKYFFQEIGFGGKYSTDLFSAEGGYTLDSKNNGADGKAAWGYAGINYKGIANLKLVGEAKWTALGDSKKTVGEYDEVIEYKVSDPITAGIIMYQYTSGASGAKTKLQFKPYGSYVVNTLVKATGEVGYVLNDGNVKDVSTFWAKPGVELSVGPNSKIYINDTFKTVDLNKKAAADLTNGTNIDKDGKVIAVTTNTIDIGFRFNF